MEMWTSEIFKIKETAMFVEEDSGDSEGEEQEKPSEVCPTSQILYTRNF